MNEASSLDWPTFWTGVIGVAALTVTVYQAYAIRKHNRVSSMPLPIGEVEWSDVNPKLTIRLCNKGLGPALLMPPIVAYRDATRVPFNDDAEAAAVLASIGIRNATATMPIGVSQPLPDGRQIIDALAPGDRVTLLKLSCDLTKERIHEYTRRLAFEAEFQSAYRERFRVRLSLGDLGPGRLHTFEEKVILPLPSQ